MGIDDIWFVSALWIGLALAAALISIRVGISVALIEIVVGAIGGNYLGLTPTEWISYLAALGAVLLTFLAGTELDPAVLRRHIRPTLAIGVSSFLVPFVGVLFYAHYALGWPWPQAQIAGLVMSTTSVAVVYAVMVETRLNESDLGKIILAAVFVTDVGTVLLLGILFANYNVWLALFAAATALALWLMPRLMPPFTARYGGRVSEAEAKLILLVLFVLGGFAMVARSVAILPAYLLGMVLASHFIKERALGRRLRAITFTLLTPFYFLMAGSYVRFETVAAAFGLVGIFLALKMATKFLGILPLTHLFGFGPRKGMYTSLMMCTGLTFGSVAALFGFNHGIIDQDQYTVLVAAVVASAVVPTLIAQRWFYPKAEPLGREVLHVQENPDRQ